MFTILEGNILFMNLTINYREINFRFFSSFKIK